MKKIKLITNIILPIGLLAGLLGSFLFIKTIGLESAIDFVIFKSSEYGTSSPTIFQWLLITTILLNIILWLVSLFSKVEGAFNFVRSVAMFLLAIANGLMLYTFLDENYSIIFKLLFNMNFNYALIGISLFISSICFIMYMVYSFNSNQNKTQKTQNKSVQSQVSKADEVQPVVEQRTPFVNLQNKDKDNLVEESFTSTPNEETFNISDKLSELKHNLHNNVIPDDVENYAPKVEDEITETIVTEDNVDFDEPFKQEELEDYTEDPTITEELNPTTFVTSNEFVYSGPIDPYKQTIVPRRFTSSKGEKYEGPIGNIAKKVNDNRNRRKPLYDENYQGKIFLGDSDRIWDALKKQATDVYNHKSVNKPELVSEFKENINQNQQVSPKKTLFSDSINSVDKINEETKQTSTIDWDD